MKKIIIILLCALACQSCCELLMCIGEAGEDKEKFKSCFEHFFDKHQYETIVAMGKAGIIGNPSWWDPIGGQIGLEKTIWDLSENSTIRAGIGVSLQGANYKEPGYSGKVTLSYIGLPILYNYKHQKGIYGEIGLQPGFLLVARDKIDGGESWSYRDFVRKFELGLPVGAGYWITDRLGLGARAIIGITNLDNTGSEIADHNYLITGVVRYRLKWPNKKQ